MQIRELWRRKKSLKCCVSYQLERKKAPIRMLEIAEKRAENSLKRTKRRVEMNKEWQKRFPFMVNYQCKIKKMSSFINSPSGVLGLSNPLLLASTSLILSIICIVFIPL